MTPSQVTDFDPAALVRARDAAGLTQRQLAAAIGSYDSHISALESGKRRPSALTLKSLASALGLDPLQLTTAQSLRRATLADLRRRSGHSQTSFSELIGIPRTTWGKVERGQQPLTEETAVRIARLLDLAVETVQRAGDRTSNRSD
jgi:transcriptional regulator with XRE-family HTH domain